MTYGLLPMVVGADRVALAAFGAHGTSVTVGHFLGATPPARPMAFASAIAFRVFTMCAGREARPRTTPSRGPTNPDSHF